MMVFILRRFGSRRRSTDTRNPSQSVSGNSAGYHRLSPGCLLVAIISHLPPQTVFYVYIEIAIVNYSNAWFSPWLPSVAPRGRSGQGVSGLSSLNKPCVLKRVRGMAIPLKMVVEFQSMKSMACIVKLYYFLNLSGVYIDSVCRSDLAG